MKTGPMRYLSPSQPAAFLTGDPCLAPPAFSLERFFVFTPIFLIMMPGGVALFLFLGDYRFGIQIAAIICYTAAIVLYTLVACRGTSLAARSFKASSLSRPCDISCLL